MAGVGALVLLAACGTTVPLAQQRALEAGGGLGPGGAGGLAPVGSSAQGAGGVSGAGASAGSTALGASGSQSGGSAAGAAGGGGGGGTSGGGGPTGSVANTAQAEDGPGVTATTINIGDAYDPNAETEDAALGAGGLNPGDTQAETNAVVAYINSHGGVAGRKINMIWAQISATDNVQTQEESTCATWTQDNKVFIMHTGESIWDQCAANAHIIGPVAGDFAQEDSAIMQQYPGDVNIDGMTLDRSMRYTIEGLQRQGYFGGGAKVGIATWDEADFQYGITHAALPALAAIGIQNPPVEYITVAQQESDLSSSSAAINNAILQFRQDGVTHVLLFDGTAGVNSGGTLALLWMNDANGQAWYPTYGLNSASGLSAIAPDVPAQELQNSLAVGWTPSTDLSTGDFNALPQSPQEKLCLQIMAAAGQAPPSQNAAAVALDICDNYFFIKYALDRVKGPLNQQTAIAAINSIGMSYPIISTFETNFSAAQHDGPYYVRNAAFNSGCTCYKYTSNPYNPG